MLKEESGRKERRERHAGIDGCLKKENTEMIMWGHEVETDRPGHLPSKR